jgi:hypothetical protein
VRWLGTVLVVLAFACSPHGVRIQPTEAEAPKAHLAEAALCEGPEAQTIPLEALRGLPVNREDFIPLNTRGYNYATPGVPQPPGPAVRDGSSRPTDR